MDFWRTVLVLLRRWYVVLPAFVLSIAIAGAVYLSVPTVYVSSSVLVLTTPNNGGIAPADPRQPAGRTNPLLNFDQGLSTSASILIQALGTPEMAVELGAPPGGDTTFRVTNGSTNPELLTSGPFVFVSAESRSAKGAQELVTRVSQRARVELANRQRDLDAPPSTYITVDEIVPPTTPDKQGGSKARAAAAVLGLGFLASLCAAFSAESFCDARRQRAVGTPGPTDSIEPPIVDQWLPGENPALRR